MADSKRRLWLARAQGYFGLVHPFPVGMTVLAALLFAGLAARGTPPPGALGWLLLSVLLSQVAIASLNDYCDRALDAVTKPWKPVPAGLVSPRTALLCAVVTAPLGVLCAVPLGLPALLAAAVGTAGGLAYDLKLKGTAWSALPFLVAFPALPIWAWSAVAPFEPHLLEGYVVGAPLVIGLHLADTLPDLEGDRAQGVRGLAHSLGAQRTRRLMWSAFASAPLLLVILATVPGHAPGVLLAAAVGTSGLVLGAWLLGRDAAAPRWADRTGRAGAHESQPGAPRHWRAAFAQLAGAAIVVGLGWLASLTGG